MQAALVEIASAQCGYYLNGMIVTTVAFLRTNPDPSDGAIKDVLRYNLFRCGVHLEILAVVRRPDSADPEQLEPFVIVRADGLVTAFNGHVDLGAGIRTALAQIVAEELDVAFNHVTMILGDTALTPDHGPTIASETIQISAVPLRRAVAQARR